MRQPRTYTLDELALISDEQLSAKEIAAVILVHPITIARMRKSLGVKAKMGKSKPRPYRIRQEERQCRCGSVFKAVPSSARKYCSRSCHMRFNNPCKNGRPRKLRNPNTPAYKRYARAVHGASHKVYLANIDIVNPMGYTRTLCGVTNGWQLDHIVPVRECFEKGLSIAEASAVTNLRMLPWKDNLMRQFE